MNGTGATPTVSPRLPSIKRRTYGVALTLAGVASTIGFLLDRSESGPEWPRWVFGPVIGALCAYFGLAIAFGRSSIRALERGALFLASTFIVARVATVLFVLGPGDGAGLRVPDFGAWMSAGFVFPFVALQTRSALRAALLLYGCLVATGLAYAVHRGADAITHAEINVLVQELVVANAFTITCLYFLSRTKEELARERTERLVMARLAHTDDLTGVPNRRFILQSLERAVERSARDGSIVSVVMFDLDRFKAINDTHGHATGDAVLRRAAELVRDNLRVSDELGRYGGEEFLIVAFDADLESSAGLAERLRAAFEAHDSPGEPRFTASFGVATHRKGDPLTAVLSRADDSLYAAKARGRNRVVVETDLGNR